MYITTSAYRTPMDKTKNMLKTIVVTCFNRLAPQSEIGNDEFFQD